MILPGAISLFAAFAPAFTQPTHHRFTILTIAAILTTGRRTVASLLLTLASLATGHRTDYQRILSRAPWCAMQLACALASRRRLRVRAPSSTLNGFVSNPG
jgi:hypothetical protein